VICYAYLWSHEAELGQEEGSKDRPVVVVVARRQVEGGTALLVAPITHSPPSREQDAVEMPATAKCHVRLDSDGNSVLITEMNRFVWPSPDIRPATGRAAGGDAGARKSVPARRMKPMNILVGRSVFVQSMREFSRAM